MREHCILNDKQLKEIAPKLFFDTDNDRVAVSLLSTFQKSKFLGAGILSSWDDLARGFCCQNRRIPTDHTTVYRLLLPLKTTCLEILCFNCDLVLLLCLTFFRLQKVLIVCSINCWNNTSGDISEWKLGQIFSFWCFSLTNVLFWVILLFGAFAILMFSYWRFISRRLDQNSPTRWQRPTSCSECCRLSLAHNSNFSMILR